MREVQYQEAVAGPPTWKRQAPLSQSGQGLPSLSGNHPRTLGPLSYELGTWTHPRAQEMATSTGWHLPPGWGPGKLVGGKIEPSAKTPSTTPT